MEKTEVEISVNILMLNRSLDRLNGSLAGLNEALAEVNKKKSKPKYVNRGSIALKRRWSFF
jgi:hypothetical protein